MGYTSSVQCLGIALNGVFLAIEERKKPIARALTDIKGSQILLEAGGGGERQSALARITSVVNDDGFRRQRGLSAAYIQVYTHRSQ